MISGFPRNVKVIMCADLVGVTWAQFKYAVNFARLRKNKSTCFGCKLSTGRTIFSSKMLPSHFSVADFGVFAVALVLGLIVVLLFMFDFVSSIFHRFMIF